MRTVRLSHCALNSGKRAFPLLHAWLHAEYTRDSREMRGVCGEVVRVPWEQQPPLSFLTCVVRAHCYRCISLVEKVTEFYLILRILTSDRDGKGSEQVPGTGISTFRTRRMR